MAVLSANLALGGVDGQRLDLVGDDVDDPLGRFEVAADEQGGR